MPLRARRRSPAAWLVGLGLCVACRRAPDDREPWQRALDPAEIRGRVCDVDGIGWLPDADVSTLVTDDAGRVVDAVVTTTDRAGEFRLADLPPERAYQVLVQLRGTLLAEISVYPYEGQRILLRSPPCFDPSGLDVLVVTGIFDDARRILRALEVPAADVVDGTDLEAVRAALGDPDTLARYDAVFLLGGMTERGVFYDGDPTVPEAVLASLRGYVADGGGVFVTDQAYDVVQRGWPGVVDFVGDDGVPDDAELGPEARIEAFVPDEPLAVALGATHVDLNFALPGWPVPEAVGDAVSVHLRADVAIIDADGARTIERAPVAFSFSPGRGRVGFVAARLIANGEVTGQRLLAHQLAVLGTGG